MSELYDKIVNQRAGLSSLVSKIPGFAGYQDANARRRADQLLRDHIAQRIEQSIARLSRLENKILDGGGLRRMSKTREIKNKMQAYRDRVMAAAPGYAGLWASIKIDAPELEKLYSFDQAQIYYADRLDELIVRVEQATLGNDNLDDSLDMLYSVAVEANDAFQLREDVITGLGKSI